MTALTVYATDWCPFCYRLITGLKSSGIEFDAIDIEADEEAATVVEGINDGNRTVPTVVFADGATMTNPAVADVAHKLAQLTAG